MSRFDVARRAALMSDLLGFLLKRPTDLLPFDEVREGLRLKHVLDRGVEDVPLAKIAGTLGREREFSRVFLPREEALRERWESAEKLARGQAGFASVELYKVGDVYFVVDGHHRVSVAGRLGQATIEARVKEFQTPVAIGVGDTIEEIVLKSGLADFLEATGLKQDDPSDYVTTSPKGYERLLEHIAVHRWYRGIDLARSFSWEEAVASWRDTVYLPMIRTIRDSGVMASFDKLTTTDLYVFVMDHLHALRERYGSATVTPEKAVRHLKLQLRAGKRAKAGLFRRR